MGLPLRIPNAFTPRHYQRPVMQYFDWGGKRAVWVVHRRGGKDLTFMHQTNKMAHRRTGAYWHVFPTAEHGRKAIWDGFTKDGQRIMECVFPKAIRKSPREWKPNAEMVVELKCGSLWRLLGSDRIELVGAGPMGVVFSEFALAKPNAWDFIRPMLRENDGWAAFISTPRGNNHLKRMFDIAGRERGWFRELLTLHDTRAFDPERTIEEERASGMPEALIRQEYLCDWTAANVGSVYGDLLEALERRGRLREFDHPLDGIFTNADLGIGDAFSLWFWRHAQGGGVEFVDHYENFGKPLSHYFDLMELWAKPVSEGGKGYRYVRHFLPHDAMARSLQTGMSTFDQYVGRFGEAKVALGPNLSVADGIQALRWVFQQLGTKIHPRCTTVYAMGDLDPINALREYHYAWDDVKRTFSSHPDHDWSSHAADSARYVACVARASEFLAPKPKQELLTSAKPIPALTFNQIFEYNERNRRR